MARKEFWYTRVKTCLPSCTYQGNEETTEALLWGIAAVLERLEVSLTFHFDQTFICKAIGGYLNEHASERNISRIKGEVDFSLAQRTKNIVNTSNCPSIKALVDSLLHVGEAIIFEDGLSGVFFNRESFYNRGEILLDRIENVFSIVIDNQVHDPYSFYNREYFYKREDFIGTNESSIELFNRIIQAVNESKACGTAYRLIERSRVVA